MPAFPREHYNARRASNCARSGNPVNDDRARIFTNWLRTATDAQLKWHYDRAVGRGWTWQKHVTNAEIIRRRNLQ